MLSSAVLATPVVARKAFAVHPSHARPTTTPPSALTSNAPPTSPTAASLGSSPQPAGNTLAIVSNPSPPSTPPPASARRRSRSTRALFASPSRIMQRIAHVRHDVRRAARHVDERDVAARTILERSGGAVGRDVYGQQRINMRTERRRRRLRPRRLHPRRLRLRRRRLRLRLRRRRRSTCSGARCRRR